MNCFRKSFTVSELDTYDKCPLQYRLQYVEKIPGENFAQPQQSGGKLAAHVTGDIIHNAIRRLTEDKTLEPGQALKSAASHLGARNIAAPDHSHLKGMIHNFVSWRDGISSEIWLAEWPFALDLNGISIRGAIDCTHKTERGWHIIDYKTDRIDREEEISRLSNEYELQMSIYCIAAKAGLGEPCRSTVLHFLETGERIEKDVSTAKLEHAIRKISAAVTGIRDQHYLTTDRPNRPCARCAYHHNKICWEDRLRPG